MAEVRRYDRVGPLLEEAGDLLLAREAEHNLVLGICAGLRDGTYDPDEAYLASVARDGEPVAVAVRTPPYNLVISCVDDIAVLPALADDVSTVADDLPGVIGPREVSATFARLWAERTGCASDLGMRMRVHRASRAEVPGDVPGALRDATVDDLDVLATWGRAFQAEALGEDVDEERARAWAERMLTSERGGLVVREVEGELVSMAGYGGPTPNGVRVFAVYTPPERRGRGYGGAAVGELTARLLETRRFCFLFTDLANPTSNRLYRRIGYEPVIDVDEHRFTTP